MISVMLRMRQNIQLLQIKISQLSKVQMTTVTLQIEKNGRILRTKTIPHLRIAKQNIEKEVYALTGLNYEQYEVFYIDAEDDLIMTVADQDYSIAEMTLEGDGIVFHVDLKVEEGQLRALEDRGERDVKRLDEGQVDQGQHRAEQLYEEHVCSNNMGQIGINSTQEYPKLGQVQKQEKQAQLEQTKQAQIAQTRDIRQRGSSGSQLRLGFSDMGQVQPQINQHFENRLPKQEGVQSIRQARINFQQVLSQSQTFERLFDRICLKLQAVLKPECFINQRKPKQTQYLKKNDICHICSQKITKIPFYINQQNQHICQSCQVTYPTDQILLKVRSEASKAELLATKYVTLSNRDLSPEDKQLFLNQNESNPHQKLLTQLLHQKLGRLVKQ